MNNGRCRTLHDKNTGRFRTLSLILGRPGNQGVIKVNQQLTKSVRWPATCAYTTVVLDLPEPLQMGLTDLLIFIDNYKENAAWVIKVSSAQKQIIYKCIYT